MLIGKNYKVESDELNVTLYRRTTIKTGKKAGQEHWSPFMYYSTIQNALKGFADMELNKSGLKDLEAVAKKQDEIYRLIEGLK